jgi:hypothetical protein
MTCLGALKTDIEPLHDSQNANKSTLYSYREQGEAQLFSLEACLKLGEFRLGLARPNFPLPLDPSYTYVSWRNRRGDLESRIFWDSTRFPTPLSRTIECDDQSKFGHQ